MRLDEIDWDKIQTRPIVGADPAIEVVPEGASYRIEVAAGTRFLLEYAYIALTTSADAANRQMKLLVSDGTQTYYHSPLGFTITASLTKIQSWVANSLVVAAGTQYGMHIPLLSLPAGSEIYVYCQLFDSVAAGDNATALTVFGKVAPI